jgi:hypothetical protein
MSVPIVKLTWVFSAVIVESFWSHDRKQITPIINKQTRITAEESMEIISSRLESVWN